MQVPLYQAKAEFFRMLGHPVRIRVLELLQGGPVAVRDLLSEIEIEPSSLSQQLAVLRRSGIVVSIREGSTVSYALAGGDVAELLRAARRILTELLAGQNELLAELRQSDPSASSVPSVSSTPSVSSASSVPSARSMPVPQGGSRLP
ncbi:metalloregulator ArsR/SmtB family transcription factor [Streptomyces sp. NPDC048737]|uniref:ArsR/SmtB family transcription factor n=1 Tax=unclassified Streptomyces TaxID=2593676 RepID=UPI0034302AF1